MDKAESMIDERIDGSDDEQAHMQLGYGIALNIFLASGLLILHEFPC